MPTQRAKAITEDSSLDDVMVTMNELPEIKMIPIKDLLFHEVEEARRTKRLEEAIISEGVLINPVVVGRFTGISPGFVLLDGANRVSALRNLGFRDVVCQVVDYFKPNVKIKSWCHLLHDFDTQKLLEKIDSFESLSVEKTNRKEARMLLEKKGIICCLFSKGKDVFVIKGRQDLRSRTLALVNIVDIYCHSSSVHRVTSREATFLLRKHEKATLALAFPVYEKKDVLNLALGKTKLPTGITRHIVPSRVLGLHVDIALLKVDIPIEEKDKVIQEIVGQRMLCGKTRFYPESVFILDD